MEIDLAMDASPVAGRRGGSPAIVESFSPAYSSGYNPVEIRWLRIRSDHLGDFFAKSTEEANNSLCIALDELMNNPIIVGPECVCRE
jgi:hypothetical protein